MNIIILTSNSIRHNYFKIMFSNNPKINVLRTYVEGNDDFKLNIKNYYNYSDTIKTHLTSRHNTEYDFISDIIKFLPDNTNSKILNNG